MMTLQASLNAMQVKHYLQYDNVGTLTLVVIQKGTVTQLYYHGQHVTIHWPECVGAGCRIIDNGLFGQLTDRTVF